MFIFNLFYDKAQVAQGLLLQRGVRKEAAMDGR
jgi:hypothetical protein